VQVAVFPLPGSRYNRPETQITFRGIPAPAIGRVLVVGSRTGVHTGRLVADSDGQGASFVPEKPFTVGETVTVGTRLHVLGGTAGRFAFAIAHLAPPLPIAGLVVPPAREVRFMRFRSQPLLRPVALTFTQDAAPASEGDIFIAPNTSPIQEGPMILDPRGRLVWFRPFPRGSNMLVNDLRVQNLYGRPVLTWWQGIRDAGFGQSHGLGIILNDHYQQIATVRAGNGLQATGHEFLVTPQGDAYLTASSPVMVPGRRVPVIDSVVQEIDIRTGLVLLEWHALDHVPLSGRITPRGRWIDAYHINSVSIDAAGNLVISMRDTSAIYDVDRRTGQVLWTLGGNRSSFNMGAGTITAFQHDAIVQPDGTLSVFDNESGGPSRGLHERLDLSTMTARMITQYYHSPPLESLVEGNMQLLADGDAVIGWGSEPYLSEYDPSGTQILDAHFDGPIINYRAYRFPWTAQPDKPPAVALAGAPRGVRLFVSWNGATDVSSWRVLAGQSPNALKPVATTPVAGFETGIPVSRHATYYVVQALDAARRVLSASRPVS